jgi:Fic/DOC family
VAQGLRDEALLESALTAARNRHHYEMADVVSCAATYAYHLTQAHAFLDGNKRSKLNNFSGIKFGRRVNAKRRFWYLAVAFAEQPY